MRRVEGYLEHITTAGETWDSIALEYFDDEMAMSDLIRFNPKLASTLIFDEGELVLIPIFDPDDDDDRDTLPPWRNGDDGDEPEDDNEGQPYDYELGDSDEAEEGDDL